MHEKDIKNFWCVYILLCRDKTFYTGITNDIDRRIKMHNEGRAAKYTKSRSPVRLVYMEKESNRSTAMVREREIKKLSKKQKNQLIGRFNTKGT